MMLVRTSFAFVLFLGATAGTTSSFHEAWSIENTSQSFRSKKRACGGRSSIKRLAILNMNFNGRMVFFHCQTFQSRRFVWFCFASQADKRLWDLKTSLLQRQIPSQAYSAYKLSPNAPHCGKRAVVALYITFSLLAFVLQICECKRLLKMRRDSSRKIRKSFAYLFKGDWPSRFSWGFNKSIWLGLVQKVRHSCRTIISKLPQHGACFWAGWPKWAPKLQAQAHVQLNFASLRILYACVLLMPG